MMRALFAGVSGLRNHQTRMDVIGNNIANINTIGFKSSRVNFQDTLSQTLQAASGSQGTTRGGTNPVQVGLGMGIASIDTIFTDGSFQPTGKATDLSVQGQGFFVLKQGNSQVYTRAGNFDFDNNGNYVVPGTGLQVMGWMADSSGNVNTAGSIVPIQIPIGSAMKAKESSQITYGNMLSASAAIGANSQTSINVYDTQGSSHKVSASFTKVADNTWLYGVDVPDATGAVQGNLGLITFDKYGTVQSVAAQTATVPTTGLTIPTLQLDGTVGSIHSQNYTVIDSNHVPHVYKATFTNTAANSTWSYTLTDQAAPAGTPAVSGTVTWNGTNYTGFGPLTYGSETVNFTATASTAPAAGAFTAVSTAPYTPTTSSALQFQPTGGAASMSVNLNFNDLTQYGGSSTIQALGQDGYASGVLENPSIDSSGVIIGKFSNGQSKTLGQVAMAVFNNPAGLNKAGDSLYTESTNSGVAMVGTPSSGGRGSLNPGTLEMSNVDLSQEFSNMIITQRGFQANSKIITTTDEMLEQLASLKR